MYGLSDPHKKALELCIQDVAMRGVQDSIGIVLDEKYEIQGETDREMTNANSIDQADFYNYAFAKTKKHSCKECLECLFCLPSQVLTRSGS